MESGLFDDVFLLEYCILFVVVVLWRKIFNYSHDLHVTVLACKTLCLTCIFTTSNNYTTLECSHTQQLVTNKWSLSLGLPEPTNKVGRHPGSDEFGHPGDSWWLTPPKAQEDVLRKRTWKVGPKVLPPGFSGCMVMFWEILEKTESMAVFFCYGNELVIGVFVVFSCFWYCIGKYSIFKRNDNMYVIIYTQMCKYTICI